MYRLIFLFLPCFILSGCDDIETALGNALGDVVDLGSIGVDLGVPAPTTGGGGSAGTGGGAGVGSGAALSSVGAGRALPSDRPTFAQAQSSGAVRLTSGSTVFFAGYRQVSSNNQNPIILRYDNGNLTWSRTNYEAGAVDARAYGLAFDPATNRLYAAFSADGGQNSGTRFETFTTGGWLSSYGRGGGPKASVVAQINPGTGAPIRGTFITAELSSGKTNTVVITGLRIDASGNVRVSADSWYSPRATNRARMNCSGASPFKYALVLNSSLSSALSASAPGCSP